MNCFFSKLRIFFIILIGLLIPADCTKEPLDVVPDTYVNVTVYNTQIGISQAAVITNAMVGVPSLGYNNNGIIIFRNNQDEYFAYDRTCTYHVEESIPVDVWTNELFAICPVCSTKYQLYFSGIPTPEGPSEYPLKQYRASYNPNTFELHITNF